MVEGAAGGARLLDDLLHRGVVVALTVEEAPGRLNDAALGIPVVFLGHGERSLPIWSKIE